MIELKYPVNAPDWAPLLRTAVSAIDRWAQPIQGPGAAKDEFGLRYDLRLIEPAGMKEHWVLRPATLHLGAYKVLQDAHFYRAGWGRELDVIWHAVSSGGALHDSDIGMKELDLLVQVVWFREQVLFA